MPKVYEYLGLVFFFYANEHLPIHVHVSLAEFESKIELTYENGTLNEGIVEKWTNFIVKNKKVKWEVITKKIK
jgi:hypothetical protein